MVVAIPSLVTKNIDQKGRGGLGKGLLGDEFMVTDGAPDEMPFTVLPLASGGREIDPGLGKLPLTLVFRMNNTGIRLGFRSMQLRQCRPVLDDTVGEMTDFRGIVPSVAMTMNHPRTHAQATVAPSGLG